MWKDLVPIAICFMAILVLAVLMARYGSPLDANFRQLMAEVNEGHQLWCQAGAEKQPRCTCRIYQPLSWWQKWRRYNKISWAVVKQKADSAR